MKTYFTGFIVGLSLIVAIGAQNAFVLRQGLKHRHIFWICLFCAISDALLISVGVGGFQKLNDSFAYLTPIFRYGGAAFLNIYGLRRAYSAFTSKDGLSASEDKNESLRQSLLICFVLTWLNPHVYLDTVVFLGMISSSYVGQKIFFAAGAVSASFIFFFSLGYGARLMRPIFANALAWRIFEGLIAMLMFFIAINLFLFKI